MISDARRTKIEAVAAGRQSGLIVVLEDIHDPHNAGAILRTCDAFGVGEVWFIFDQEKPYNPRRVGKSSSSTANKWLDYRIFSSASAAAAALKRKKYASVATALDARAKDLYEMKLDRRGLALWFGNEHRGLSPYAIRRADRVALIPMRGMVQSLNVSVTAALVIAEVARQRGDRHRVTAAHRRALVRSYSRR